MGWTHGLSGWSRLAWKAWEQTKPRWAWQVIRKWNWGPLIMVTLCSWCHHYTENTLLPCLRNNTSEQTCPVLSHLCLKLIIFVLHTVIACAVCPTRKIQALWHPRRFNQWVFVYEHLVRYFVQRSGLAEKHERQMIHHIMQPLGRGHKPAGDPAIPP